jgi:D-glycero-D-manno-heptose 1,7-bisphosphate phosphatase
MSKNVWLETYRIDYLHFQVLTMQEKTAPFWVSKKRESLECSIPNTDWNPSGRPAVFFDRDGILNEIVMRGETVGSPRVLGEFLFKPGARKLVASARDAGFLCIVVTNQPDIERGFQSQVELDAMHRLLEEELSPDGIEVCPAGSADDRRKKPNPGMLLDAAERWAIDLGRSWIVGDSDKDIGAGRLAGIKTILLATEYNKEAHAAADFCFRSLAEIADFLSNAPQPTTR